MRCADWSARKYSHDTAAAPLPPYLKALARHFASLAAASRPSAPLPLERRPPSTHSSPPECTSLTHSPLHVSSPPGGGYQVACCAGGAQSTAPASSDCTGRAGPSRRDCSREFAPDAALVNYYWQGKRTLWLYWFLWATSEAGNNLPVPT